MYWTSDSHVIIAFLFGTRGHIDYIDAAVLQLHWEDNSYRCRLDEQKDISCKLKNNRIVNCKFA